MPLLDSDVRDMTNDLPDGEMRPRSGSTGLRGLFSGKLRQRSKSGTGDAIESKNVKENSPSASSKVKNFFDQFRPRSKSDLSGVKKPGKKHREAMNNHKMDNSMDEAQLRDLINQRTGDFPSSPLATVPQGQPSPMGHMLGHQLSVPNGNGRVRHTSSPASNFMNSYRQRSNSDSRTKPPKRSLVHQVGCI